MSTTFTALDFETAQGYRHSICQVGLVRVEEGKITGKINLLVQPPGNDYWSMNIGIHGITPAMTRTAPTFDQVWPRLAPYICNQHVVAHNAAFDVSCLHKALEYYGIAAPSFQKHCTYRLYKSKLSLLCATYGIELNHHDALSDALACARLFLMHQGQQDFR
ncbi:3'-5' exonuclease [Paraflavisolibacter sp. H34]|uniref:3'-5' exonuclease n=1 Tax=Huijunlia imazamoxiresistens TaxID=3127457 RepID=UPI003017261C